MHHPKDKTDKTGKAGNFFPGEVLSPKIWTGRKDNPEIRSFEQTPSDNPTGAAPEVAPDELFHLFTASIILQKKVFIR